MELVRLVNEDGTLVTLKWEVEGRLYQIVETLGFDFQTSVWDAMDTVKRHDGSTHKFRRKELSRHFKKVKPIKYISCLELERT